MKNEMNRGYTCTCGKEHKYGAYVFAHWREVLIHTCDACGAKHEIIFGYAKPLKEKDDPHA